jgi:hypothetical protein
MFEDLGKLSPEILKGADPHRIDGRHRTSLTEAIGQQSLQLAPQNVGMIPGLRVTQVPGDHRSHPANVHRVQFSQA